MIRLRQNSGSSLLKDLILHQVWPEAKKILALLAKLEKEVGVDAVAVEGYIAAPGDPSWAKVTNSS